MGRLARGSGRIHTRIVAGFASFLFLATSSCVALFSLDDHQADGGGPDPDRDSGNGNDGGNPPQDGSDPGSDSGSDGSTRDTGTDAPPGCTGGITFRTPKRIDPVGSTTNQYSARGKNNDINSAYIATDIVDTAVDPGSHIWRGSRANATVEFGSMNRVGGGFGSTSTQRHGMVNAADDKILYVQALSGGLEELIVGIREGADGFKFNNRPWERSGNYSDTEVYFIQDGALLFFATNRAGKFRIYQAQFNNSNNTGSDQKAVGGLGNPSADDERAPVVSDDGTKIFFARKEGGQLRIKAAQRGAISGNFAEMPLCGLDIAGADQYPTWISKDGSLLFYIRVTGGQYQLWQANRAP